MYVYHYHAMKQTDTCQIVNLDGLIHRDTPLTEYDQYKQLKADIDSEDSEKLTICSLTLISS